MGTKHLTEADRLRARMLFFDSGLSKSRICQLTGFSLNQVKLAIREKTPKSRCGRPPRRRPGAAAVSAPMASPAGPSPGAAYMAEHSGMAQMTHVAGMTSAGGGGSLGHAPGSMPDATVMDVGAVSSHTGNLYHPQHHHHHMHQQHQHHPQQPLPQVHHLHQPQHHYQEHEQQQQQQPLHPHAHPHQDHHHQTASMRHKWEPEYSPSSCYAWTSHPAPPSTSSTVSSASTHYGNYGRALSPPPINSLRAPSSSSSSSSLLGIHSLAGYDRGYHDGHSSSGGSTSSQHGLSSSMSTSSLASSATSYSSMSPSPSGISPSSMGGHGGFSLPAILATAARP